LHKGNSKVSLSLPE